MDVRSALEGVAGYSHLAGRSQPAQLHLQAVHRDRLDERPVGFRVLVSGSGQSLPVIPWIALLDEDVTTTAQDGLYLVYLFAAGIDTVFLSMNQGVTQHRLQAEAAGLRGVASERQALAALVGETDLLRGAVSDLAAPSELETISLGGSGFLPRAYEAGSIAARRYNMAQLPTLQSLRDDLDRFLTIYSACVDAKADLASKGRITTSPLSDRLRREPPARVIEFKPKDAGDYLARVVTSEQRRTRKHEQLVRDFGEAAIEAGLIANTRVHPRDLVLHRDAAEWLVEAKTVGPNAEYAVREAIGQLLAYRHLLYRERGLPDPRLLALFSAPIGGAFESLLLSLGIQYVFREDGRWQGSAAETLLVDQPAPG